MDTYIRFQTQLRCANTGRPAGLFLAAGCLEDSGRLAQSMLELLREHLTWFNDNLTVPSLGVRGWRCVFWFRSHATQFISRMWDLAAILNEEGVSVKKRWTTKPGMIVYRDDFQIGAVPESSSAAFRI